MNSIKLNNTLCRTKKFQQLWLKKICEGIVGTIYYECNKTDFFMVKANCCNFQQATDIQTNKTITHHINQHITSILDEASSWNPLLLLVLEILLVISIIAIGIVWRKRTTRNRRYTVANTQLY